MRINPKLKKRVIIAVVIIVCLAAAVLFIRYRKSKKKDEKQLFIENKLRVSASYSWQGWGDPKFFDYAIQQYEEILKFQPKQKEAIIGLADVYTRKGLVDANSKKECFDKAEKLYKRSIGLDPKNAAYIVSLGTLYFYRGEGNEAMEKANQALLNDPRFGGAYLLRALIYESQKNLSLAIINYKKAQVLHEKKRPQLWPYSGLARLFFNAGLPYDAVGQLEKATRIWPKLTGAHLELANYYFRMGLIDKTISVLNSVLKFDKGEARTYYMMGLAYLRKQDYIASYANFKRAKSLGAEVNDAFLENLNKAIQKEKEAQQGKKENAEKNN